MKGITVNGHSAGQLSDGGSVLGSGFPFRKPHKKLDKGDVPTVCPVQMSSKRNFT